MKKIAIAILMMAMGTFLFAQDQEMKPMKYDNSIWYEVVYVDFKTGKVGDAKKIIEKYESTAKASGLNMPEKYWFETGSYDLMHIWKMEGGPADMEWKWTAIGVKWWKAFVKQEGSVEAAEKIEDEYDSLVAGSKREIVRMDN